VPYEVLCQGWREYSAEVMRPRKVELVFLAGGTYVPLERVDTLLVVQITQGNSHFGRCFGRRRGHTPAARPCSNGSRSSGGIPRALPGPPGRRPGSPMDAQVHPGAGREALTGPGRPWPMRPY
jgi:hypothetical protein